MFKIWAKIIKNDKIRSNLVYSVEGVFEIDKLQSYVSEICEQLDLSTPVVLASHIRNFENFNFTRFVPADFVESVSFDALVIEFMKDNVKKEYRVYKAYLPID